MAYGDFKDLAGRTAFDKVLRDKAFNIAKNPKYDGYQRGLASMVYKFFDKKSASLTDKSVAGGAVANNEIKIFNSLKNYINSLLDIFKREKFIQDLK